MASVRDHCGQVRALDRAIPVVAADDLVITCFLEYGPARVNVHDVIRVRRPEGWTFRKGVYRTLRLAADEVVARLETAGFTVERHQAPGGMVALVDIRPSRPASTAGEP